MHFPVLTADAGLVSTSTFSEINVADDESCAAAGVLSSREVFTSREDGHAPTFTFVKRCAGDGL